MRYPAFLQEKGTIGFVAPSFGCATEPYKSGFLNAQKRWKEQGFHLQLGPNCYVEEGVGISNTPKQCGEELTAYYCDKNNDCLISCGGGELMCEILDYVDFEQIRQAAPKCGTWDIRTTRILLFCWRLCVMRRLCTDRVLRLSGWIRYTRH